MSERWVQDQIAEDPTILGLGDVVVKDKERMQPNAGRLDLLLRDPETLKRYEVEPTDRAFWEAKGSHKTLTMTDDLLQKIVRQVEPKATLKYNRAGLRRHA
ncbi:MAG: hypothetical protein AD742_12385 [Methylibium sp. NZG]|nr:MAG: hypothetical protein AD742_12385 [Methylibium sp. NZG]